jgi:protein phosphatase
MGIGRTDVGHVRRSNQDAYAVLNDLGMWFLADGMGGHAGGDIAAQTAVAVAMDYAKDHAARLQDQPDLAPSVLIDAVVFANKAIHDKARLKPYLKGMGTTFVGLGILPSVTPIAHVVHLGDSRAYHFHDGSLTQLTKDHTLVEGFVNRGLIDAETARTHPDRHVLIKALGMGIGLKPELTSCSLGPSDMILLCTDGLNKMLDDAAIAEVLARYTGNPDQASHELIREALAMGGEDNVTVIVCAAISP